MSSRPSAWRQHVVTGLDWEWRGDKLWHRAASPRARTANPTGWAARFVGHVYADQNHARVVRRTLQGLLGSLPPGAVALNIGAGKTDYPGMTNLEICDGPAVDIIGHGSTLPFRDATVDLAIAQEVLEHVPEYPALVSEIHRILKPGGVFYCQVPFQIGFHPGPADYWRFSRQAMELLFSAPRWSRESLQITLGHGSGFYRIAVEFWAVTFSCLSQRLYRPAKAAAAVLCYPFKWFDLLTPFSQEKDRIPGGYLCVARKL